MRDTSKRVLSARQLESNQRMRITNDYAKFEYATKECQIMARIRLKTPAHKSLYHALVKEYLLKPKD